MGKTSIEDLRFAIYINNDKAVKSLIELEAESGKLEASLRKLISEGKNETAEYKAKKDALQQVILEKKKLDDTSKALAKEMQKLIAAGKEETAEFKKLKTQNDALIASKAKLTTQATALNAEMQKLRAEGKAETAEFKALTAAINANKEKHQALRKEAGLSALSIKELKALYAQLRKEFNAAIPGSPHRQKLERELAAVDTRLKQVTNNAKTTGMSFGKMADGFNKYFGIFTAFAATFTGVIFGFRKATDTFALFDDKVADVMKTTNLAKDEVLELDKSLQKVDTRTAQNSLLDLAKVAGKLGIAGQDDIEGFVKAADKIGVALTEDLGGNIEESVNQIGKLVDIFGIKSEFGVEQAMLKTGSAINSLGASSTANEGYIVEFTKRMAGVAPAAKLSMENVLGLAATLDQFGQTSEVSSTVISALLPDMFKSPGEYAKIAGMSIKDFNDLLNKDSNQAFIKFLEGLKGNSGGLGEMAKKLDGLGLEGKRSISVLGVLSNNTDTLRKQQQLANVEFAKGTSLTDEFNKKNNSAQAVLEKKRKALELETRALGEKLLPVMTISTNVLSKFLRLLSASIDFYARNAKVINGLVLVIGTYIVATKIATLWQSLSNKESAASIVLAKLKVIWDNAVRIGTLAAAAAQALFTGNLIRARAAMALLTKSMNINPFVLLLTVVVAAGYAIYQLSQQQSLATKKAKMLADVQAEVSKGLFAEKIELLKLLNVAKDKNRSDAEREAAIKKLNEISPEYLGNLTKENVATKEGTKLVDDYVKSLERAIRVKVLQQKIEEAMSKAEDVKKTKLTENLAWYEDAYYQFKGMALNPFDASDAALAGQADVLQKGFENKKKKLKDSQFEIATLWVEFKKALKLSSLDEVTGGVEGKSEDGSGNLSDAKLVKEKSYYEELKKLRMDDLLSESQAVSAKYLAEVERITKLAEKEKWTAEEKGNVLRQLSENLEKDLAQIQAKYRVEREAAYKKELEDAAMSSMNIRVAQNEAEEALRQKRAEKEKKDIEDRKKREEEAAWDVASTIAEAMNFISQYSNVKSTNRLKDLEKRQKKELSMVAGNQAAEEAINKKYEAQREAEQRKQFEKEKRLKIAEIQINGAIESAKLWASTIYPWGVPASAVMQGVILARVAGQTALVAAQEYAGGNLAEVIGTNTGKSYKNVPVEHSAGNKIYSRATLVGNKLVGEDGPELVLNAPTTRNLFMNYPGITKAIKMAYAPAYASGNLQDVSSQYQTNSNNAGVDMSGMEALLMEILKESRKPVKAWVSNQEIKEKDDELTKIHNIVSLK